MSNESFDVVCRFDEAIDAENSDRQRFRETLDMRWLKFLPGDQPTVYHCRRLTSSEMREVARNPDDVTRYSSAFALGVTRVDAMRIPVGEGEALTFDRRNWVKTIPSEKHLNDKALNEFDFAEIQEVGGAIWGRCHLGKGRPAAWPLPATSQHAIAALVSHRAERMRRSAANSPPTNAPPVEPSTHVGSVGSATSGDATATGSTVPSP